MGFFDYNHEQQREEKAMYYQKEFFKCQVKKNESITRYTHNLDNLGKDGESWSFKIIDNLMLSKMKNGLPTHPLLHFLKHRIVFVSQRRLHKISRRDYSRRI